MNLHYCSWRDTIRGVGTLVVDSIRGTSDCQGSGELSFLLVALQRRRLGNGEHSMLQTVRRDLHGHGPIGSRWPGWQSAAGNPKRGGAGRKLPGDRRGKGSPRRFPA